MNTVRKLWSGFFLSSRSPLPKIFDGLGHPALSVFYLALYVDDFSPAPQGFKDRSVLQTVGL